MSLPTTDLVYGALGIAILGVVFGIMGMSSAAQVRRRYLKAFGEDKPENVEQLVASLHERLDSSLDHISGFDHRMEALEVKSTQALNRVGMVRFNPFMDTGADLSFSMAVLNDHGDGVVMTSLWGREEVRLYAKPMEKLESRYPLSQEEKQAIDIAANARHAVSVNTKG